MEPGSYIVGAWCVAILVVAGLALYFRRSRHRALRNAYQRLATHLTGRWHCGTWLQSKRPTIWFEHAGFQAKLDLFPWDDSKNSGVYHRLVISGWPDPLARCEIFPERAVHRVTKLLGMVDFTIGSPEFDSRYIISGSQPDAVRKIITPAVQSVIENIRVLSTNDYVYMNLAGGKLEIRVRHRPGDYEDLARFVTQGLHLCDVMLPSTGHGIDFKPSKPPTETPLCQVCGDDITEEPVYCKKCRTPQHLDCWRYYGGCAVYACGGKKAMVRVRRKKELKQRKP